MNIVLRPTCAWCGGEPEMYEDAEKVIKPRLFAPTGKRPDFYCAKCKQKFLDADAGIVEKKEAIKIEKKEQRDAFKTKKK